MTRENFSEPNLMGVKASFGAASDCRVSVIIPTYRRLDKLKIALQSVADQTIKPAEVMVVASDPDELLAVKAVVDGFELAADVQALSSDHKLLGGAARNIGWRNSKSELIFFLDDDDFWHPEKIERHIAAHSSDGADVVYSNTIFVHGGEQKTFPITPPSSDMRKGLVTGTVCPPSTSCVSVRRDALESVSGFDDLLPSYQDWELWLRLANGGKTFASVDVGLTYFVQHAEERTSMNFSGRTRAAAMILEKHNHDAEIACFLSRERVSMLERKVVFAAMLGEAGTLGEFFSHVGSGTFRLRAWRTYWIFVKIAKALIRVRLTRWLDPRTRR